MLLFDTTTDPTKQKKKIPLRLLLAPDSGKVAKTVKFPQTTAYSISSPSPY